MGVEMGVEIGVEMGEGVGLLIDEERGGMEEDCGGL